MEDVDKSSILILNLFPTIFFIFSALDILCLLLLFLLTAFASFLEIILYCARKCATALLQAWNLRQTVLVSRPDSGHTVIY